MGRAVNRAPRGQTTEAFPLTCKVPLGPDGKAEMVNYRVKGDLYIVDRLFERGALLLGGGE